MNLNGMVIVKFQLYLFEYSFLKINYSQAQEGILENLRRLDRVFLLL